MKSYENFIKDQDKRYWKIPTDEIRFFVATSKINIPKDVQEKYYEIVTNPKQQGVTTPEKYVNQPFIYLCYDTIETEEDERWGFMPYEKKSIDFYKRHNYKFSKIQVTPEEIEEYKREVEANKYNL